MNNSQLKYTHIRKKIKWALLSLINGFARDGLVLAIFRKRLLFVLILFIFPQQSDAQSQLDDTAIALRDNWQIRWGDSPQDASGRFSWLNDSWDDPDWEPANRLYFPLEHRSESKKAWFRVKLPEAPIPNGIYIADLFQVFQVFQGQRLIYQFGELTSGDDIQFLGLNRHLIQLKPEAGSQILSFRIQSDVKGIGFPGPPPQLLNLELKWRTQAAADIDDFLLGSLFIFMGLFALVLFLINRSNKMYLGYGAFLLGCGCWMWVNTLILGWWISTPRIWYYIDNISLYIVAAGLFYFLEQILGDNYKKYARFLWISHLACFAIAAVQDQIPGMTWIDADSWYFVYLPSSLVLGLIVVMRNARMGGQEARLLLLSHIVVQIFGITEMIYYQLVDFYQPFLMPWGLLIMVLLQGRILTLRYVEVHRKLKLYSSQLERHTRDLEDSNQNLLQMDQLKNEFLASTSHELRTPLHGITGLAEGMLGQIEEDKGDTVQKNLSLIVQSGRRLSQLIDDILDVSRMEHDDLNLELKAVDLREITEVIFILCQPLTGQKSIVLKNEIPVDYPPVRADENRLQQIMYNLVGNAIKFTHQGQVVVKATVEEKMAQIRIQDTGIGMDANHLQVIFEPFRQVESISKTYQGIGLGLTITKKLVELHQGSINVNSTPGNGSCFTITLPLSTSKSENFEKTPARTSSVNDLPPMWKMKLDDQPTINLPQQLSIQHDHHHILVVDDDPINLQVAINQLSPQGYRLSTAINGLDALEILEDDAPFDLIILDVMMPQMNGYQACAKIRERYSSGELPIILLTAKNQTEDMVQGLHLGANDYLTKPFAKEELLARVQTHLKLKEAYTHLQENVKLRQEIQIKEQIAQELFLAQQRLAQLLNHMDDAVCAFTPDNKIYFLNDPALNRFNLNLKDLLGQPLKTLLSDYDPGLVKEQSRPWKSGPAGSASLARGLAFTLSTKSYSVEISVDILSWETMDENGGILIFGPAPAPSKTDGPPATFQPPGNSNLDRQLHYLELVTENLFSAPHPSPPVDLKDPSDQVKSSIEIRSRLVEFLNKVIHYWESTTLKTKVKLAEESDLWTVNFEQRGVFRVRTMERHQHLHTLPKSPRWQVILETADYVLEHCPDDRKLRPVIKSEFEALKEKLAWTPPRN